MKASGLLLVMVVGLAVGSAAAAGVLPVTPPLILTPLAALLVASLTGLKMAATAGGLLHVAISRD